jgi:putative lipoic acid-binding regulatory protein
VAKNVACNKISEVLTMSKSEKAADNTGLESVIAYPIDFPIKIMGPAHPAFLPTMTALVRKHAEDFDEDLASMRPSKKGKYVSLTLTIRAVSREQLDNIYQELSDHPMVSMAL